MRRVRYLRSKWMFSVLLLVDGSFDSCQHVTRFWSSCAPGDLYFIDPEVSLHQPVDASACAHCETMTKQKQDQRAEIRFCMKLGLSRVETRRHLVQIHGGLALSQSQVNHWFIRIQSDQNTDTQLKDKPRNTTPRKLIPAKIREIQDAVQCRRKSTCRQIAAQTGVSNGSAHTALRKNLQMKKKSAKWIPHLLTPAQCNCRVDCARSILQMIRRRGRPLHIIAGDESWFWTWQPGPKQSTKVWLKEGEDRPEKPRQEQSTPKFYAC